MLFIALGIFAELVGVVFVYNWAYSKMLGKEMAWWGIK